MADSQPNSQSHHIHRTSNRRYQITNSHSLATSSVTSVSFKMISDQSSYFLVTG